MPKERQPAPLRHFSVLCAAPQAHFLLFNDAAIAFSASGVITA
jgi:hypothetical protein